MKSTCLASCGYFSQICQGDEIVHAHVAAQEHFVADQDAIDVVVLARHFHQRGNLVVVVLAAMIQPGTGHDLEAVSFRDRRYRGILQRRISADAVGVFRQQLQVGIDLIRGRINEIVRILITLIWRVGEAGDLAGPVRNLDGLIQYRPHRHIQRRDKQAQQQRTPE